jgi:hypothetical protein
VHLTPLLLLRLLLVAVIILYHLCCDAIQVKSAASVSLSAVGLATEVSIAMAIDRDDVNCPGRFMHVIAHFPMIVWYYPQCSFDHQ